MYRYTLKPFIKSKHKSYYKHGRLYLDSAYACTLIEWPVDYQMRVTLSTYLDVVYYSKNKLRQVPAGNGVLVDVSLYDEEEIGETN